VKHLKEGDVVVAPRGHEFQRGLFVLPEEQVIATNNPKTELDARRLLEIQS